MRSHKAVKIWVDSLHSKVNKWHFPKFYIILKYVRKLLKLNAKSSLAKENKKQEGQRYVSNIFYQLIIFRVDTNYFSFSIFSSKPLDSWSQMLFVYGTTFLTLSFRKNYNSNQHVFQCMHTHACRRTHIRTRTHTRATTLNTVESWGGQRSEIKKVAKNNLCKLALATAIRNSSSTIIALSGLLRTHALASAENFHTINSIIHTTNSIIHIK